MASTPQAYRVKSVDARVSGAGAPAYRVTLEAIYYGPDEDGPKVGQVLHLGPRAAAAPETPKVYQVKSVDARVSGAGAPAYRVTLEAIYYGPDEGGPKVGQVLHLGPRAAAAPETPKED